MLEQLCVVNSGGAGGHAGEATQAEVHLVGESFGWLEFAIGDRPHEGDASARAVALDLCGVIGGAGWQAKSAMHALLQDGIIEAAQHGMGLRLPLLRDWLKFIQR